MMIESKTIEFSQTLHINLYSAGNFLRYKGQRDNVSVHAFRLLDGCGSQLTYIRINRLQFTQFDYNYRANQT